MASSPLQQNHKRTSLQEILLHHGPQLQQQLQQNLQQQMVLHRGCGATEASCPSPPDSLRRAIRRPRAHRRAPVGTRQRRTKHLPQQQQDQGAGGFQFGLQRPQAPHQEQQLAGHQQAELTGLQGDGPQGGVCPISNEAALQQVLTMVRALLVSRPGGKDWQLQQQ